MYASKLHNIKVVELLIQKGANINAQDNVGYTALMYASRIHNIKVLELLIQKGADINAFNNYVV